MPSLASINTPRVTPLSTSHSHLSHTHIFPIVNSVPYLKNLENVRIRWIKRRLWASWTRSSCHLDPWSHRCCRFLRGKKSFPTHSHIHQLMHICVGYEGIRESPTPWRRDCLPRNCQGTPCWICCTIFWGIPLISGCCCWPLRRK